MKHLIWITFLLILGCATLPETGKTLQKPIFYPATPEEPRLQFLTSFSSSKEFEFNPSAFNKFITGATKGSQPVVKPYGVAVFENRIYLCDTVNKSIDIFDLESRKFEYFLPREGGRLVSPINLCFDQYGNMYVADSGRGKVLIYNSKGDYVDAIGSSPDNKPVAVAVRGEQLYVADIQTHSVRVFSIQERSFQRDIPAEGSKEEAKLFSPVNLAVDDEGNIYVSDMGAFRVQKYSPSGEFLMSFGGHGDAFGQFARPKGVAVDKEGRVYVADARFENVQIFDKEGKLLLFFGEPGGSPASLSLPAGVAVDYTLKEYFSSMVAPGFEVEYLVIVISQYGERKLNIFGFGHKKE